MRKSKSREEGEIDSESREKGEGRFTPLFLTPLTIRTTISSAEYSTALMIFAKADICKPL